MGTEQSWPWWQKGIIYQIYPRSFQDTSGDGVGDLQGLINRLDYLNDGTPNSLGVEAIWISPFYPSPMADHGYDVADYCNVDPLFGDLATFDRLVEEAHQRGIKVIVDYVPNHTSDQHPWFLESRSSRDNPKRDWYLWRDPRPDGSLPNNWGSFFGGPAWTWDEKTEQYYLHQFTKEQPDLNWRNPATYQAMLDVLRFWFQRGVDGFRMDVVGLILKEPTLKDNPPNPEVNPAALHPNDVMGRTLSVYNMDQDEVHDIMKAFRQLADEFGERVIIGELWGEWERWVKYYGPAGDEIHLPFNFRLMYQPWSAGAMRQLVKEMEAVLPPFAWPNYVLGNHDQMRLATRFGGRPQARVAMMMLLTLRGTPTWYYGDELGMENVPIPAELIQDPQAKGLGAERTRDVARTPMQWDNSANGGFAPAGATPWLPLAADYQTNNVHSQNQDSCSMLNLFRQLSWLRRGSMALAVGSYHALGEHPDCFIYQRQHEGETKVIALNFSDQPQTVSAGVGSGKLLLSTHLDRTGEVNLEQLELRPYEGVILYLG